VRCTIRLVTIRSSLLLMIIYRYTKQREGDIERKKEGGREKKRGREREKKEREKRERKREGKRKRYGEKEIEKEI
jgi:hypothetical protein